MEAAAQERHRAEVRHACMELLRMEDWSGASRDRFLGVRPNTAFEQRLKQVSTHTSFVGHERILQESSSELVSDAAFCCSGVP